MTAQSGSDGIVKSDETLFDIVERIFEREEAGVTEIADEIGVSKGTVHKHLKTLEQHGYVVNEGGRYRLGLKFLTFGGYIRDQNPLCRLGRETATEIAGEANQMGSFVLREDVHGVMTFIDNDRYGLRDSVPLGNRFLLHQNGSGKAILAELPDEEIEAFVERTGLPAETDNTITDPDELWDEIRTIREHGYATSFEERIEGVQSVAAAVSGPDADIFGAITLAGPAHQLTEERIHSEYAETIVQAANDLELQARYRL